MWERHLSFQSFYSTGWLVLIAAGVAAALVLIVLLLRYERRLVSRPVGFALLALRITIIGLIFLTLLEPVMTWSIDRQRTGRILVAVDLSESMETTDKHAGRAEKLRWARALGLAGNEQTADRYQRWIEALEQGKEPQWVGPDEEGDPARREQLAQIRKKNFHALLEQVDLITRKEMAWKLLSGVARPLLPQLQETADVELVVFAGKSQQADAAILEAMINQPPETVLKEVSDLSQPLGATAAISADSPLLGIVLLTDGRDNAGRDATAIASRLGRLQVPVHSVMLGSELRPRDLAIALLDYPQTVFKDDKPLLKATLNTNGFEGKELEVFLEREGEEPLSRTVTPENTTSEVEFELDAEELGRHEYTLRLDPQPGETREDNNAKTFAVNVVDDRVHVLLLEGEARWEFRFLDNALSRDERVDVQQVVYRQPYMGVLKNPFFDRSLEIPTDAEDLENSPFAEPELVILGDIAPDELPERGWELLEKFVSESGGTLVLLAGKNYFPLSHRSPVVERLLPIRRPVPVRAPGVDGFHLKLTADGEAEAMFQFGRDEAENRAIWSGLPGHYWGIAGEAKPGGSVYAVAQQPGAAATLESERQSAVIVHQNYGFGQVLWIGIDSTWRWRKRVGDQYHHRFWGQLARWAADNKAASGNEVVRFGPEKTDLELGEEAVIRAKWLGGFLKKFPNLQAQVEVYRKLQRGGMSAEPFNTLALQPAEGRPLVHEARAVSLPVGEYRLKLTATGADLGDEEIAAMLFVHEQQTPELSDLSSNRQLLNQLAASSGGKVFLPDEIDRLPAQFRPLEETTVLREEVDLWNNWIVLAGFFTLLMTEWVLRKLNGLP